MDTHIRSQGEEGGDWSYAWYESNDYLTGLFDPLGRKKEEGETEGRREGLYIADVSVVVPQP